jgi:hypothetical protein
LGNQQSSIINHQSSIINHQSTINTSMFSNQRDYRDFHDLLLYKESTLEERVQLLTELVFELLREVEALRSAQIRESESKGIPPKDSEYGKSYLATSRLTHNSCGPTGGIDKLLALWVGWYEEVPQNRFRCLLREVLMLRRLGFTESEIDAYIEETIILSTLT